MSRLVGVFPSKRIEARCRDPVTGIDPSNPMVRDPGLVIEMAQVGRYSSANRRSTSCSILLREGAITVEAEASSRKAGMSRCVLSCPGRLPSQPLYTRLGLGESVLGYIDSFLILVLPCTPSCTFLVSRGLLRRSLVAPLVGLW